MVEYLHRHGRHARLIRRNLDSGGHWTIELNKTEYDPTCADWPDPPPNSHPGTLYQINPESPHHAWRRTRVNNKAAYEVTGIIHRTFQKSKVARISKNTTANRGRK
jgi:hypothetical protein